MTGSDRSDEKPRRSRTEEEYAAGLKRLAQQEQECDDRARMHNARMSQVMELVAAGWQGSQARAVLRGLEDAHQSISNQYAAVRRQLDEQQADLRRERRAAEEARQDRRGQQDGGDRADRSQGRY